MADQLPDRRSLLRQEETDLSEVSTAVESPTVQSLNEMHRLSYHRMASQDSQVASIFSASEEDNDEQRNVHGLGIMADRRTSSMSIKRVPVASKADSPKPDQSSPKPSHIKNFSSFSFDGKGSPQTPGSANPLLSPAWVRLESGDYTYGYDGTGKAVDGDRDMPRRKITSFHEDLDEGSPEFNNDRGMRTPASSINFNDQDKFGSFAPPCATHEDIHTGRGNWLSISILGLSIYSTVFSGIWMMLALVRPRYGRMIHSGGSLTPSTASIVFALFAKTIELSFVTVFVTFLGQVLSRRSLVKSSRGVTVAEMSMRTWVIQPGFLITHWSHLRHVGVTLLGIITFIAALNSMFYTTASDALVSPHLKYGRWETREMKGRVQTSYANPMFIRDHCETPISDEIDPEASGLTCLSVEHAGQAYHNFLAYMTTWATIRASGEGESTDIAKRPPPVGMLYDNTTVTGSWVETNSSNVTLNYEKYNRMVNNVTVSMPHAGIFSAARARENSILQPAELAGVGEYSLEASVVSPTINVLCVNMSPLELSPLIYVDWPNATTNETLGPGQRVAWPGYQNEVQVRPGETYLNSTVVDDIFQWGEKYERQPPIFPMLPIDYNSLTNVSVSYSDSIYILAKAPEAMTTDYTLCQMRSYLSTNCSTRYNVSGTTGGHIETHCEDPDNDMAYSKSVDIPGGPVLMQSDWRNVISEWALSLSLNTGISNANASTSRLLTQFIPYYPEGAKKTLNTLLPSIGEALGVLAGCTLLLSTTDSSFLHYWEYDSHVLSPGAWQPFNASISSQQYTSGYTQDWQAVFYLVLILVFGMNVFCLVYFFIRAGLVTDFTEPPNLFALAINSPPSHRLGGSCGGGPTGDQLSVDWHVAMDDHTNHVYIKEGGISTAGKDYKLRQRRQGRDLHSMSSYSKLSSHKSWL
ncbi:hypothetical protein PVAG01_05024 [Phlyctema vagabunda]|uniref:Mcm2 3 5 family protein n=1 Tax=Phlyctema vagabunda TaxID=108571 RepID=A0ABR4PJM3_9HELO